MAGTLHTPCAFSHLSHISSRVFSPLLIVQAIYCSILMLVLQVFQQILYMCFYGALISFGNIFFFSVPKVFFYVWWPSNRFKKAWIPELWPCLTEFFAYVLNVSYVKINADDLCPFLGQTPEQNHSLHWATAPITFYENAFMKFLINEDFLYFILNNLLNITIF